MPRSIRLATPPSGPASGSRRTQGSAKSPLWSTRSRSAGVEAAVANVAASLVGGQSLSVLAVGLAPAESNVLRRLIAEKKGVVQCTVTDAASVGEAMDMLAKHSTQDPDLAYSWSGFDGACTGLSASPKFVLFWVEVLVAGVGYCGDE